MIVIHSENIFLSDVYICFWQSIICLGGNGDLTLDLPICLPLFVQLLVCPIY